MNQETCLLAVSSDSDWGLITYKSLSTTCLYIIELHYSDIKSGWSCLTLCVVCLQSSGKLDMERGMVKPMIRGEQQDSRWVTHSSPSSCRRLLRPPSLSSLKSIWLVLLLSFLSVFSVISPSHGVIFVLSGLRTFQQTEQSWLCQPESSSETTVSISVSLSVLHLSTPLTVSVKQSITGNYWTSFTGLILLT